MTTSENIARLEEISEQAKYLATHSSAVSRSFGKIDPMVAAMFHNVSTDAQELVDQTAEVIEKLRAQHQLQLDEVFRTLVMTADNDAPTWDDQWEVDQARIGEDLRYRVESEVL